MDTGLALAPITPAMVRYIKLGPGGRWVDRCLTSGEIHFGHGSVPHAIGLTRDKAEIRDYLVREGKTGAKASDFAREITDFYALGSDCLWVTEAHGSFWWAYADPEVIWIGGDGSEHGARMRRVIGSWRNTDRFGRPLTVDRLSSRLTKVMNYRQTQCSIEAEGYLRRKLNGEEEPIVLRADAAREGLIAAAGDLIANLHWSDFETFVDLLFARSGWHRTSAIGGTMKDADLVLEQAITGETAFVQVKSSATQATLEDYLNRFEANPAWSRMFFVCHSPQGELAVSKADVQVWTRAELARRAVASGLFDWLMARAG